MYIKIHKSYRTVIAICDAEILGKKFEEGKRQLEVTESFFKGEKVDEEKAVQIIERQALEDATFNIAGEKSIKAALKAGIINEAGVSYIKKVPFALVLV